MKSLGDEIFVQRDEKWALDFNLVTDNGNPFMLYSRLENPYLAITITSAKYAQIQDFRETYWLDLKEKEVEQEDGSIVKVQIKSFIYLEPLKLTSFDMTEAYNTYKDKCRIVVDDGEYDIKNYLFYIIDEKGNKVFKYLESYVLDDSGNPIEQTWSEPYEFRIVKIFDTYDWIAQSYLLDMKIVSGQSVVDNINEMIQGDDFIEYKIERIADKKLREFYKSLYFSKQPLMPTYDINSVILEPTKLTVSTNIQRGMR